MRASSINITYDLYGKSFEVYVKTGIYDKRDWSEVHSDDYRFVCENDDADFTIDSRYFNESLIDLNVNDKVSIALFGKRGSMFLVYNHNSKKYKYWPEAINDLYYRYDRKGFIDTWKLERKLKKAKKIFPESQIFRNIISKLNSL